MTEIFGNIIGHTLGANKNQDLGVFATDLVEMLDEFATLLKISADFDVLGNIVIGSQLHGADVDLNHVVKEILYVGVE